MLTAIKQLEFRCLKKNSNIEHTKKSIAKLKNSQNVVKIVNNNVQKEDTGRRTSSPIEKVNTLALKR